MLMCTSAGLVTQRKLRTPQEGRLTLKDLQHDKNGPFTMPKSSPEQKENAPALYNRQDLATSLMSNWTCQSRSRGSVKTLRALQAMLSMAVKPDWVAPVGSG